MTAHDNVPFPTPSLAGASGPATGDEETLKSLEQMLADPEDRLCTDEAPSRPADRCALARELLERLDSLVLPGQRDLMGRVISILETEMEEKTGRAGDGDHRAFCDQLALLRHEAERPWPDAASFCRRAEDLISMLEAPAIA